MACTTCTPVYVGYGNILTLLPYSDITTEERLDMTGATKVEVCIGAAMSDSDAQPSAIWWEDDPVDGWVIRVRAGLVPGIVVGEQCLRVVAFDADFVNGLVLTSTICLDVIGACA